MKQIYKVEGTITIDMDGEFNDAMLELIEGETKEQRRRKRAELLAMLLTMQMTELKNGKVNSGAQNLFKALQDGRIQLQDVFYLATCTLIRESNEVMDTMLKDMGIPPGFLSKMQDFEKEDTTKSLKDLLK